MAAPTGDVTRTSRQWWWTLALVCTAAFMLLLDISVVSVALPWIQRDLHASLPDLQWVSSAYALVLAVLLPALAPATRPGSPPPPSTTWRACPSRAAPSTSWPRLWPLAPAPGVAALVPPSARAAVTHAARAGTVGGLDDVLLAAAAFAPVGALVGFAFGPDPAIQPAPNRPTTARSSVR